MDSEGKLDYFNVRKSSITRNSIGVRGSLAQSLRLNDPRVKFERELKYFLNEKKFAKVKEETEEYKYPPIVHI